jgi:hypothetical protein
MTSVPRVRLPKRPPQRTPRRAPFTTRLRTCAHHATKHQTQSETQSEQETRDSPTKRQTHTAFNDSHHPATPATRPGCAMRFGARRRGRCCLILRSAPRRTAKVARGATGGAPPRAAARVRHACGARRARPPRRAARRSGREGWARTEEKGNTVAAGWLVGTRALAALLCLARDLVEEGAKLPQPRIGQDRAGRSRGGAVGRRGRTRASAAAGKDENDRGWSSRRRQKRGKRNGRGGGDV